jgi:hypothetical protein
LEESDGKARGAIVHAGWRAVEVFGKNWKKLKSGTDWHCSATLLQWTRKSSFLNSTANGTAG